MQLLRVVQLIEQRRQRRRLAAAGCSGHENDSVFLAYHFVENRWESEAFDRRHFGRQFSHDDGVPSVLLKDVYAEPRQISQVVATVARSTCLKVLQKTGIGVDHVHGDFANLLFGKSCSLVQWKLFQSTMNLG